MLDDVVRLTVSGQSEATQKGEIFFSSKRFVWPTDPTSSSNGRPVLLVEGLHGEMIEMDHASFALGSYCVAEATERELEDFYQWSQLFSNSDSH